MEKEINVNGKVFKIRELLASEFDICSDIVDKKESLKKQVLFSTGMSEEEYSKLTFKERLTIVQTMNDVNGLADFQKNSNQEKTI